MSRESARERAREQRETEGVTQRPARKPHLADAMAAVHRLRLVARGQEGLQQHDGGGDSERETRRTLPRVQHEAARLAVVHELVHGVAPLRFRHPHGDLHRLEEEEDMELSVRPAAGEVLGCAEDEWSCQLDRQLGRCWGVQKTNGAVS
jgi:hypothetical protein